MNTPSGNALDSSTLNNPTPSPTTGPLAYGYTPAVARHFDANPFEAATGRGRVVRVDRNRLLVAVDDGLLHLPYPLNGDVPVTGDWVWMGPNRAGQRPRWWTTSSGKSSAGRRRGCGHHLRGDRRRR